MFLNHLNRLSPAQTMLDGQWLIAFDPENRGKKMRWQQLEEPPGDAHPIAVPSCWEEINPHYDGVAWYWTTIEAASPSEHERLVLIFDAVNYYTEVWVNGTLVGASEGGYTPFSFDITNACRGRTTHLLTVRVLCPPKDELGIDGFILKELPCWRTFESFNFGGIWQSVRLLRLPHGHVRDLLVLPNVSLDGILVQAEPSVDFPQAEVSARLQVRERTDDAPIVGEAEERFVDPAALDGHAIAVRIADPALWSPEAPDLYTLRVRVDCAGQVDEGEVTFGLRSLTFRDNHFHLNGEPYFIKGGFHEGLYPIGLPRPPTREFVVDELQKAKGAGFNLLRYWQIPIHPIVLDVADELGVMLMDEPPIEWMTQTDETARRCRIEVERLVRRDRNRASVVFWTMLNETGIQPDFDRRNAVSASRPEWEEAPIQRIRDDLCKLARRLDPSRLIINDSGGFMGHANIYLPGESAGRPFNDLHTYQQVPIPEARLHELRQLGAREGGLALANVLPGVGALVSEFGYGSFPDFESILARYATANAMHTEDYEHQKALFDSLRAGFEAHGMSRLFESEGDLVRECQRVHAEGNALQTMALRANPLVAGYVMHAFSAGGCIIGAELFDTWRQPKLVAEAVREVQEPHVLAAFFRTPAVSVGEALHVDLFSVRDASGVDARALTARVTITSPSGREQTVPLGPATLAERVSPIWAGAMDLDSECGAYSLRFELVGESGQVFAEASRTAVVVADESWRVDGPVACIGGDHVPARRELEGCGVPVTHNAALAPIVLSVPREWGAPLAEGYHRLLSDERTVIMVVPNADKIRWVMEAFGIEGHIRTGVGNWSPVSHYFVEKRLQAGLPPDRLLGQAYAGVTPRHCVVTEVGETLAGCLSYIRGHILDKQYEFWWGKTIFELPVNRARLIVCTFDVAGRLPTDLVARQLLRNLIEWAAPRG